MAVAVVQLAPPGASPADLPATHFLLVQRPPAGLLAGLWQFPLLQLASEAAESTVRVRGGLLGGGGGGPFVTTAGAGVDVDASLAARPRSPACPSDPPT